MVPDAPEEDHPCDQPAEDDQVHEEDEDAEADGVVELEEGDEGPGGAEYGGNEKDEDLCGDGLVVACILVDEIGEYAPGGDED